MGDENEDLYALARQAGAALARARLSLATAESCTGGWVAACVTDVAGSSEWFERGYVTYSNAAKAEALGVDPAVIERHGAVSEPTVRAMAAGALRQSRAGVAVAVSGIAGPGGGTPEKPVGTVWFAWQRQGRECRACCHRFEGDRRTVRRQAVAAALRGIVDACRE
jgi:nicotinamide-nucleotide amidase